MDNPFEGQKFLVPAGDVLLLCLRRILFHFVVAKIFTERTRDHRERPRLLCCISVSFGSPWMLGRRICERSSCKNNRSQLGQKNCPGGWSYDLGVDDVYGND